MRVDEEHIGKSSLSKKCTQFSFVQLEIGKVQLRVGLELANSFIHILLLAFPITSMTYLEYMPSHLKEQ
jgi:hypothetical protein